MNTPRDDATMRGDDAVEVLLQQAAPRPAPPVDDEAAVREAVQAEWQAVTRRHKTRRQVTQYAIAATVLLGLAIGFNALQVNNTPLVQVATIHKSHGSVYMLGEQSELTELADLSSISAGQVIVTGDDAGIGLSWSNGGSLRIDRNTRIEFISTESVFLSSGQIYFDSQNEMVAAITGSGVGFTIETDHGSVEHLGTQYMTYTDSDDLKVSVREGQVEVDGAYVNAEVASAGQQLTVSGGSRPTVVDFNGYGEAWDWIEATAPVADIDGRTVDEFLMFVGRETGLKVEYESSYAEQMARSGVLRGNVDMRPRDELAFRMSGEDLAYRIDNDGGTIYVSAIDSGSRE